jgi:hypothetical protein
MEFTLHTGSAYNMHGIVQCAGYSTAKMIPEISGLGLASHWITTFPKQNIPGYLLQSIAWNFPTKGVNIKRTSWNFPP